MYSPKITQQNLHCFLIFLFLCLLQNNIPFLHFRFFPQVPFFFVQNLELNFLDKSHDFFSSAKRDVFSEKKFELVE